MLSWRSHGGSNNFNQSSTTVNIKVVAVDKLPLTNSLNDSLVDCIDIVRIREMVSAAAAFCLPGLYKSLNEKVDYFASHL